MAEPFLLGINDFSADHLSEVNWERIGGRLSRAADQGAKVVRVLLPWNKLQPERHVVPDPVLRWLESYLDASGKCGLHVMPVFFCGELRESSWLPDWMCETPHLDPKPLDFFRDRDLIRAQQLQIDVVVGAFSGHAAVLGWDLGRETTRWALAPDADEARSRLLWLLEALKTRDETHPVTLTLSQSDFEDDPGIRPSGLAEELDFLSIRVTPDETSAGVSGQDAPGFYSGLARALSGKPILISELVIPDDDEEAERFDDYLESGRKSGALGALAWSDDEAVAESSNRFAVSNPERIEAPPRIHVEEESYYSDPASEIRAAYEEYLKNQESEEDPHEFGLLSP